MLQELRGWRNWQSSDGEVKHFPQVRQKHEKQGGTKKLAWPKLGCDGVNAQIFSYSQNKDRPL